MEGRLLSYFQSEGLQRLFEEDKRLSRDASVLRARIAGNASSSSLPTVRRTRTSPAPAFVPASRVSSAYTDASLSTPPLVAFPRMAYSCAALAREVVDVSDATDSSTRPSSAAAAPAASRST